MYRAGNLLRVLAGLFLALALSACTADHKFASDAEVARARYVDPNPPSITLFTSINTRNKSGAHAGLMINGSQRVLFDPAGEFANDIQPPPVERNDLIYGMTPSMLAGYVNYQGSGVFQVVEQTVFVTPEVAEMVMQNAIAHGSANKATCTKAISTVLAGVPGFESLPMTYFPKVMMRAFATLPGVQTQTLTSQDGDRRFYLPGTGPAAAPRS